MASCHRALLLTLAAGTQVACCATWQMASAVVSAPMATVARFGMRGPLRGSRMGNEMLHQTVPSSGGQGAHAGGEKRVSWISDVLWDFYWKYILIRFWVLYFFFFYLDLIAMTSSRLVEKPRPLPSSRSEKEGNFISSLEKQYIHQGGQFLNVFFKSNYIPHKKWHMHANMNQRKNGLNILKTN